MSTQSSNDLNNLSHEDLVTALIQGEHAQNAWSFMYHQEVAQLLGVNNTDHKCLDLLKSGPLTPGELATATNLTTGAVTSVLDRLERRGFVKREHDSEDRRRIIVRVDIEKLKREVAPLFGCLQEGFSTLCASYTDDQLRFLIDYFRQSQAMLEDATKTLREQEVAQPVAPVIS